MPRGRPRKRAENLPAHIDLDKIPRGVFWDKSGAGRWFVVETGPTGRPKTRTIAGPSAQLSELHALAEERAGVDRKTLRGLLEAFHASPEFRGLSQATRNDYENCRDRVIEQRTKLGGSVADLLTLRITRPLVQVLIDRIGAGRKRNADGELIPTPATAAHALRYLRVAFRWGGNRGLAPAVNPAQGPKPPKHKPRRRLPSDDAYQAVVDYARKHGRGTRGSEGSVAPYLWAAAEIAYLCRLRLVEVVCDMTDAQVTDAGLHCARRKGSLANITRWDDRLRSAHATLLDYRRRIWEHRHMPTPLRAEDRRLVVGTTGAPLTRSAFKSAWQRMITAAIADGAITTEQRFSMHDLKRRGITHTAGNRSDKQQAGGHRQPAMVDVYDHDIAIVDSAATSRSKKPK